MVASGALELPPVSLGEHGFKKQHSVAVGVSLGEEGGRAKGGEVCGFLMLEYTVRSCGPLSQECCVWVLVSPVFYMCYPFSCLFVSNSFASVP